jgi:AraC-like DNA-binding protein
MMKEIIKKKEGFQGQKAIIIPKKIIANINLTQKIVETLHITDIGFYPNAKYHFRERLNGSDQNIFIYCFEGKGTVAIQNQKYELQSGEFIIIPAKEKHWYEADKKKPWSIYWIHFKGTLSESILELARKNLLGYKGVLYDNRNTLKLFDEIYAQLERGYSIDNLTYANMCFWHFLTSCIYNSKYDYPSHPKEKDVIDRAIDFLKANTHKILTLHEIADEIHLSASHFSFLFKNKTGFSPIEYFNHLKIQLACQHLLFTHNKIKVIAYELGIDDPYYFSRLFKRVMGVSPEEYRDKRKA